MKRMIACEKCSGREVQKYPGEWFNRVLGTAKTDMICDWCCPERPIKKGDKCAAESLGINSQPYYAWESEYIEIAEKEGV